MAIAKKIGSIRRFGARYGRRNKHKVAVIEASQRAKHKCLYCNKHKVRRISVGIWHCECCNATIAGKAYTVSRKVRPKEDAPEKVAVLSPKSEEPEEEE